MPERWPLAVAAKELADVPQSAPLRAGRPHPGSLRRRRFMEKEISCFQSIPARGSAVKRETARKIPFRAMWRRVVPPRYFPRRGLPTRISQTCRRRRACSCAGGEDAFQVAIAQASGPQGDRIRVLSPPVRRAARAAVSHGEIPRSGTGVPRLESGVLGCRCGAADPASGRPASGSEPPAGTGTSAGRNDVLAGVPFRSRRQDRVHLLVFAVIRPITTARHACRRMRRSAAAPSTCAAAPVRPPRISPDEGSGPPSNCRRIRRCIWRRSCR